jgi:uncharacterized protein
MDVMIERLLTEARREFRNDSSGHDFAHLERVLNLALRIQADEGGDRDVVAASAVLHDIHRIIQNETGEYCSPRESLPRVRAIIESTDFPKGKIERVLHCIEYHEEYPFTAEGQTAHDLETLVLQDADNLDAIGAIGIGRTFMYGGSHGAPMWAPQAPLECEAYDDANADASVIHHFHSKLLRLKESMNTNTGRELAARRHEVLEWFVDEFMAEWRGER